LQSLAPTNPHWACVEGYGPFFLCVIHKEGLCPSSGDINRLMMMIEHQNLYHLLQNYRAAWCKKNVQNKLIQFDPSLQYNIEVKIVVM
jgi:hypothetical protein